MFGKKNKLHITDEKPCCRNCLYCEMNEEYDLICKGKKTVEPDGRCRKYKLDITKAANERKHFLPKTTFDKNDFKL